MGGLQRKLGTHRKWGDDSIGGILPLSQLGLSVTLEWALAF